MNKGEKERRRERGGGREEKRSGEESGREGKERQESSVILLQKSIQGSCCMSKRKVRLQIARLCKALDSNIIQTAKPEQNHINKQISLVLIFYQPHLLFLGSIPLIIPTFIFLTLQ